MSARVEIVMIFTGETWLHSSNQLAADKILSNINTTLSLHQMASADRCNTANQAVARNSWTFSVSSWVLG
jgi:hypothetical protein